MDDAQQKSEAKYRALFENMLEGVYQTRPDGKILSANPALVRMLGYDSEEELRATTLAQDLYTNPEDRKVLAQKLENEGRLRNVELRLKRKDGQQITLLENARVIRDEQGSISYYEGLLTDITERKRAEEALRESEGRFKQIAENSMEWIWEVNAEGEYTYASPVVEKILGYRPEEILGKHFYDLFHPEDREKLRKSAFQVFAEKRSFREFINRNVHKNGDTVWLSTSGAPILDDNGDLLGYRGADIDITERKRAENALRESEERYRLLVENAGCPVTLFDVDGKILLINNAGARNLGGVPDDFLGKSMHKILPGMAEVLMERNCRVIEEGVGLEFEDLIELPSGSKRWFWSNLQLIRDADGKVFGVQIVSQDITESKRAEEQLQATHSQLQATLNALPDLLFEVDRQGRILDFRAPHPELLYRSPEEFIGKKVAVSLPPEAARTIMASIEDAAATGRCRGATYSLEMHGTTNWFELSVAAKNDPKSPDSRFIALVRDITERKRTEDQLRKTTDELKAEREALTEKNIALKQVLEHLESERQDYRLEICQAMEKAIAPFMEKLRKKAGLTHAGEFEALEANLNSILAKDLDDFKGRYARLTSRESEICEMIRSGMSSKQISDNLNLSLFTVLKHREQIRKKLDITNRQISLATYLRSH